MPAAVQQQAVAGQAEIPFTHGGRHTRQVLQLAQRNGVEDIQAEGRDLRIGEIDQRLAQGRGVGGDKADRSLVKV